VSPVLLSLVSRLLPAPARSTRRRLSSGRSRSAARRWRFASPPARDASA